VSGHTPGPWRVEIEGTESAKWPHIVNFDDYEVAQVSDDVTEGDESAPNRAQAEANARLIAAAPEMYELLKEIDRCGYLGIHDDPEDAVDPARELIKRIEGSQL
jgi:hypothetical protein